MRMVSIALLAALTSAGATAQTSYYQCTDRHGQPVFSQRPCGEGAEKRVIDGPAESGGTVSTDSDPWDQISAERELRSAEREVKRVEGRISALHRERDSKIAGLKGRSGYANNNLAGAQYMESLATEMQAINDQYRAKIESEERRLDRLREQMDRVREAQASTP